jgi:cell division protein FtsZ
MNPAPLLLAGSTAPAPPPVASATAFAAAIAHSGFRPAAQARVIAVGRAGAEMAEDLRATGTPGLSFAVVDGDGAAIEASPFGERLFVGARLTRGFGAGGDPELARAAAEEEIPGLRGLCQGQSFVFLLAGLGGGSGTGISPVVARIAREAGASVFAFVTAPFECEGSRRQQQSLIGLHRLKTVADGVLCLPNEKMLLLVDDRAPLLEVFRASRGLIGESVACVWNLLTRPGLLNVSFADICSVLRGPNLESAFARVEVDGPERATLALQRLLAHPMLAHGETLRRAESLLVSFAAGSNLGMGETRRIMDELNRQADGARVVVGATVNDSADDRLTVTVIASTRQVVVHETGEDPASPRSPAREPEGGAARSTRHFAPPPPELSPEQADQLLGRQVAKGRKGRRKPEQAQLPFEVVTRGRFEKCEPTVRRGHNLDQPTYLRRGMTLN